MGKKGLALVLLAMVLCFGCQKEEKNRGASEESNQKVETQDGKNEYSPILSDAEIDTDNEYPYVIKVNRKKNCVTVYGADDTGKYIIPVRSMICSTGGDETPVGTFQIGDSSRWQMDTNGEFCQYATRIVDDVVFCSAAYYSQNNDDLNVEQFNRMGKEVSGSSIRLETADAKWIAKNCPAGTKVEIYEDKEEGPLGKPQARILKENETKDPTDNDKNAKKNKDYVPIEFYGIEDKVIGVSQGCDLLAGISAQDSNEQDLTAGIQVFGDVDVTTPGTYEVVYMCRNEEDESRLMKCNIQVMDSLPVTDAVTQEAVGTTEAPVRDSQAEQNASDTGSQTDNDTVVFRNPVFIPDTTPTPVPVLTPTPQPTPAPAVIQNTQPAENVKTYGQDTQPPEIQIVAATRYVSNVEEATLSNRIRVTDDSGVLAGIYITVQPLKQKSYYVIIYEAEDVAGNKACVSETVQIPEPTVFR